MNHEILWGEGLLLSPQHFQEQQRLTMKSIHALAERCFEQPWGIDRVVWDDDLLVQGVIQIQRIEAIFPDGLRVSSPHSSHLPTPRYLNELDPSIGETTVYLCCPMWQVGKNIHLDQIKNPPALYRYCVNNVETEDSLTNALPVQMQYLIPNLSIQFEHEARQGVYSMAIGRLLYQATGRWVLDHAYIPPVTRVSASDKLVSSIKAIQDAMLAKSLSLSQIHRQRDEVSFEYASKDLASFWLKHTLHSHYPLIVALLTDKHVSLSRAHRVLSQFAAALMTFSVSYQLTDLPALVESKFTETFDALSQMIRDLLATVVATRFIRIELQKHKPTLLSATLDSAWDMNRLDLYLAIRTEKPKEDWLTSVALRVKVGTPDDVDRIIHTALPGSPLTHSPVVPPALPIRMGQVYFALERQGPLYDRMMLQRHVAIYVPETMSDVEFELIAVYR